MTVREREGTRHGGPADGPAPLGAMTLWVLTATVAALTAASYTAELGWTGDQVVAFRPHYVVVGAACLVGMVVARRGTGVLVAAVTVAANAVVLAPFWLDTPAPAPAGAPTLTVLWHNVNGIDEARAEELAGTFTAADVVVLAQVEPDVAQALRASPTRAHDLVYHDPRRRVLVLAQVPVTGVEPIGPLPAGSRDTAVALEADLGSDGRVAILGLHTLSPRTPRRAAVRDAELAVGASWAADQDGHAVLVGDLNTPPWSRAFRDLARSGGLHDSLRGHGLQPTWPARWGVASVPIDHALHSDGLAVVARSTGPALGAAHRSVRVTVAPVAPSADAPRSHPAGGTQPRSSR